MAEISYRGHRFPSAIIQHAVWPYLALHAELSRRRGTPRPDPCARGVPMRGVTVLPPSLNASAFAKV